MSWQNIREFSKMRRLTPKREAAINEAWPRFKKYMDALKTAGMYEGLRWSADRKYKPIHIDTKEQFTEILLRNHSISNQYHVVLK